MTLFQPNDRTPLLALPYLIADQAQKHVTVNEALNAIDRLMYLSFDARDVLEPPAAPVEGATYSIGAQARGAFLGYDGYIAIWRAGQWAFHLPREGWRAWNIETHSFLVFSQNQWIAALAPSDDGGTPTSPGGSGAVPDDRVELIAGLTLYRELMSVNLDGANSNRVLSVDLIPHHRMFLGVAVKVIRKIEGTQSWRLGDYVSTSRYGHGLPVNVGTRVMGLSSPAYVYWADQPLVLNTEKNGVFSSGQIDFVTYSIGMTID